MTPAEWSRTHDVTALRIARAIVRDVIGCTESQRRRRDAVLRQLDASIAELVETDVIEAGPARATSARPPDAGDR